MFTCEIYAALIGGTVNTMQSTVLAYMFLCLQNRLAAFLARMHKNRQDLVRQLKIIIVQL